MVSFNARMKKFLDSLAVARTALGLPATLDFEVNRRYARVFSVCGAFRSALVFVDIETGDVYRADSWRKRGRLMQKEGV